MSEKNTHINSRQYMLIRLCSLLWILIALGGCQSTPLPSPQVDPVHLRQGAQVAYQQGDLLSAESMLLRNTRLFEKDVDSWFLLGNLYLRTAQYAAAQRAYRNASKYKPEQPEIWHNLALVYLRQATQALLEGQLHSDAEFEPLLGWLLQMQGAQSTPEGQP